jgi:UDP-sulfoquinovose synthase
MNILITGADGYLGWSLVNYLGLKGHDVFGADNFYRRSWVAEMDSHTIIPISSMAVRQQAIREVHGIDFEFQVGDLNNYIFVKRLLERNKPDVIVNFAHQPSAPYSMQSPQHAVFTQINNLTNNLNILWAIRETNPDIHLVSLGTMGIYGVPGIDVTEGFFDVEFRGRKDTLPFPHQPWSIYHASKCHEFTNMNFLSKLWDIPITDINQGVVYGTRIEGMEDPRLKTRFDIDSCFGTAINRFCAQAVIGFPLTPYGSGDMIRGFIALRDSMRCLELAIKNPPESGKYEVYNQLDEIYGITQLAEIVMDAGLRNGLKAEINRVENPRAEKEKHYYNPDASKLRDLGFKPKHTLDQELDIMLKDLKEHRQRIEEKRGAILPKIKWK